MVTQLVLPYQLISWVFLILSLLVSMTTGYNCPRVEITGTLVWGPSWNWYKLCRPSDHGCKHCPQGYARVYCHQQPQASDSNSFDDAQDQPIACAVCFNGYNFYGPECTTDSKLITDIEGNEEDRTTPKLEDELEDGESTQEPDETAPDSEIVTLKLLPFKEDQPPNSNPVEREVDNTSLLWLGIGGLISLPFIIVVANGVYKRRHSMWTRIQEVRQMSNISNTSAV